MSPEHRADDRLIMLISRWPARHIGNAELERGLAETSTSSPSIFRRSLPASAALEMIARETLETLALGV